MKGNQRNGCKVALLYCMTGHKKINKNWPQVVAANFEEKMKGSTVDRSNRNGC